MNIKICGWRPWTVFWIFFLLSACAPVINRPDTPQPVSPLNLKVYSTVTVPVIFTPTVPATEVPVPTPTPFVYTIAKGDTLSSIALRYGVTLNELMTLNPDVNAMSLSVGQTINVPSISAAAQTELPAPAEARLGSPACFPSGGGLYCLVSVYNPHEQMLENVKVQILLLDANGQVTGSQEALLPLNILPAGETLPAAAFFPGLMKSTAVQSELAASIRLSESDARYLPAEVDNLLVGIGWGGLSAQVQGQVLLSADSRPAQTLWLAGVAYDGQGNIAGYRRWEWTGLLPSGGNQSFSFSIYSLGAVIDHVAVLVEARP